MCVSARLVSPHHMQRGDHGEQGSREETQRGAARRGVRSRGFRSVSQAVKPLRRTNCSCFSPKHISDNISRRASLSKPGRLSLSLSSSFYFPVLSFILGKKLPASRQSSTSLACARRAFARSFGITHSLCPAGDKVHCSLVVERRRRQLASDRSRRSEEGRTRNGWREASSR